MSNSLTLTGDTKILEKVNNIRINLLEKNSKYIFAEPLRPILSAIEQNIVEDSINEGRYSHVFSGKLLNSIDYELKNTKSGLEISFGYFVPYGLDLELGDSGETVPINKLIKWVKEQLDDVKNPETIAKTIQSNLEEGQRATPIIVPIWEERREIYFEEVSKRILDQWA